MKSKNILRLGMDRAIFIKEQGPGYISLFLLLISSVVVLTLDVFFDLTDDPRALQLMAVLALLMLGELLYLWMAERRSGEGARSLLNAGISGRMDKLKGPTYEKLMSDPGDKTIINSWVFNMASLEPLLSEALESDATHIHITILGTESSHWEAHFKYIGWEAGSSTAAGFDQLAAFLRRLPKSQQGRVHVYTLDDVPRFMIHGSGETFIVGNYWPNDRAENCPQLILRGPGGSAVQAIMRYLAYVEDTRVEITADLIAGPGKAAVGG